MLRYIGSIEAQRRVREQFFPADVAEAAEPARAPRGALRLAVANAMRALAWTIKNAADRLAPACPDNGRAALAG